jgi:hypothetical protein
MSGKEMAQEGIKGLGAVTAFEFELRGASVKKEMGQARDGSTEGPIIIEISRPVVNAGCEVICEAPQKIKEARGICDNQF